MIALLSSIPINNQKKVQDLALLDQMKEKERWCVSSGYKFLCVASVDGIVVSGQLGYYSYSNCIRNCC